MSKRLIFICISIVGLGVIYLNKSAIKNFFSSSEFTSNQTEVRLLLREDPTVVELAEILEEKGVVKSLNEFLEESEKQGYNDDSFDAGKYVILTKTRLPNLVKGFAKNAAGHGNSEVTVNVVFNHCKTIEDIGKNISKCILADSASIVSYIYKQETLDKYNFTREQAPALFLPGNYKLYFDTDAETFVAFMAEKFRKFWNAQRKGKLQKIGLHSPSQAVTLASIVYSEQAKIPEEWPTIAKLYLNRLESGIKLQSDPTFKFCWGNKLDGVRRLLNKHRKIDCPYNTYIYKGLPPGPICVTPEKVVDAVLNPADVDYIFMCAKPEYSGRHNFTKSPRQHAKNARIFQRWIANEQ